MSKLYLRAFTNKDFRAGDPGDPIRFTASTEGIKRDGVNLKAEDWFIDDFKRNPVFLWVHDYWGERPPIGLVADIKIADQSMDIEVEFDQQDEFARSIEGKYRRGFLSAVSVGWGRKKFVDGEDEIVKNDLLDISAVPVPGDPDALMERQYRALQELYKNNNNLPDNDSGEVVWSRVAVSMMRLFRSGSSIPVDEREEVYKQLRRDYKKLGKTPPDFLTAEELKDLTLELIRGLFLEGETNIAPWVLSELELTRQEITSLDDAIAILKHISETVIPKDPPEDDLTDKKALEQLKEIQSKLPETGVENDDA